MRKASAKSLKALDGWETRGVEKHHNGEMEPPVRLTVDIRQVRRYVTCVKTIVSSKGRIVPPAENAGVIDWLLACPRKDFFVPIDSESTDAL